MKKITFAALLILTAFVVCAWSAKGKEGTRPPAETGAPDPAPDDRDRGAAPDQQGADGTSLGGVRSDRVLCL